MDNILKAKEILTNNNQTNLLNIFEKTNKKQELAEEIIHTDFEQINRLYSNRDYKFKAEGNIEPITCIDKNKLSQIEYKVYDEIGKDIVKKDKYAVITMAGGQGTRLGFPGPKGTYKLNINGNEKYIFEILADTLKRSKEEIGNYVYWYIMTSVENNDETVAFFEKNNYFGYPKERVKFFTQKVLPLIDFNGNVLIDKDLKIKYASDGNGGVFDALKKSKMLDDMIEKDINWIYVCGVDNIMANMVDTVFLGLTTSKKMPSASKSVKKAYPEEKVGIFCKKNGKPAIIEYTDMDDNMIYEKNENGELKYGESNILGHLFNIQALKDLSDHEFNYHSAKKKNCYINSNLEEVIPTEPNSYKFESFIFDGFDTLSDMIILRVNREEEFAPIKNETGKDSPETATAIYKNYFKI